jgi:hypothetical protein
MVVEDRFTSREGDWCGCEMYWRLYSSANQQNLRRYPQRRNNQRTRPCGRVHLTDTSRTNSMSLRQYSCPCGFRSDILADRFKLDGVEQCRHSQRLQCLRVVSPLHLGVRSAHHILPNRNDFPYTATGPKLTVTLSFHYLMLSSPHWRSPEPDTISTKPA